MKVSVRYYDQVSGLIETTTYNKAMDVGVSDRFLTIIYGNSEADYNMSLFNKDRVENCTIVDAQHMADSSLLQVKEKPSEI